MPFLVHFDRFSWCILSFIDEKGPKRLKLIQFFDFEWVQNEFVAKKLFSQTILAKIYWQF